MSEANGRRFPEHIVYGEGAIAWKTEKARLAIWSSPLREDLVQYLDAVRNCYQAQGSWQQVPYRYYLQAVSSFQRRLLEQSKPQFAPVKADWLIYGGAERQTEITMMRRLTEAMLKQGVTIAYLVRFGSAEHERVRELAEQFPKQFTLVDLYDGLGTERRRPSAAAVQEAWKHFQTVNEILEKDLRISSTTFSFFLGGMAKRLLWERLKPYLHYDRLLVRNHFGSLDSVIALDALKEGKPVATLQHGVISSSGFFPVLANTVLTFGRASAEFMAREDRYFAERCGTPVYASQYIPVGLLFDEIHPVENTFSHRTILVIDQFDPISVRFYGMQQALSALARASLAAKNEVGSAKLIVRLHPASPALSPHFLRYASDIEVSRGVPLHKDIRRATVAIGLFSGALTVAAASGIPTFFLWEPGWFYTPDLSCFAPCFVDPEQLIESCGSCMQSQHHYESLRRESTGGARWYYHAPETCAPASAGDRIVRGLFTMAGM